jgi:hypothetical protein
MVEEHPSNVGPTKGDWACFCKDDQLSLTGDVYQTSVVLQAKSSFYFFPQIYEVRSSVRVLHPRN